MATFDIVSNFRPVYDDSLRLRPHSLAVDGVGAVAAQATTREGFSRVVMDLLREGMGAQGALEKALDQEDGDMRERFQVAVVDSTGGAAAFTGSRPWGWRGHRVGAGWVAAGNSLAGARVVHAMGQSFGSHEDLPLEERLLTALDTGIDAGGDRRGHRSAQLRVTKGTGGSELSIRIHEHAEPAHELRRLVEVHYQENDIGGLAVRAADVIRASLPDEELEQLGDLTTYQAVERIRAMLAEREAPPDSLEVVDRVLSALAEQTDFGTERFSEVMKLLPA
jgi:uncharacterized Ntn-hydrolase superfamily protein